MGKDMSTMHMANQMRKSSLSTKFMKVNLKTNKFLLL